MMESSQPELSILYFGFADTVFALVSQRMKDRL